MHLAKGDHEPDGRVALFAVRERDVTCIGKGKK